MLPVIQKALRVLNIHSAALAQVTHPLRERTALVSLGTWHRSQKLLSAVSSWQVESHGEEHPW